MPKTIYKLEDYRDKIVEYIKADPRWVTSTDIMRHLGIPMGSTNRLLKLLEKEKTLERDKGKYWHLVSKDGKYDIFDMDIKRLVGHTVKIEAIEGDVFDESLKLELENGKIVIIMAASTREDLYLKAYEWKRVD
jgi:hypothetical protein